nr:glycosyltransferase family 2 protein [uncultured Carboxylicivirga sp.]
MSRNNNLSIIIIAYNEEKYLPVLLDSLKNQSVKNFEVIVVDSNSSDKTPELAESFKTKFTYFKYLKLPYTNGPARARNKGIELASYERLIFLDADTRVRYDFVERLTKELLKYDPDVATCPVRIAENHLPSNLGAMFLNSFMIAMKPVYSAAYGACLISTKELHLAVEGFREDLALCEDCNYVKRSRRQHGFKYKILSPYFYTSDRRAMKEGGIGFMLKYIKIHVFRMLTGKEILKGTINYEYGNYSASIN